MTDIRAATELATYALRLGDDALIAAQRLAQWVASAPQIEEDIALGNIALDLLGQARTLLAYAGEVEGAGRSEDDLAFLRDEAEFTNLPLVEGPDSDFAVTMARMLFFSTYQRALYARLRSSSDETLAGVAGKAVKEVDYHRDHATQWVVRLGDGTDVSHTRMQAAVETTWPGVVDLFVSDRLEQNLVARGIAVDVSLLQSEWDAYVNFVLGEATMTRPTSAAAPTGGRGAHTEDFGGLLDEMQQLYRSHQGASW